MATITIHALRFAGHGEPDKVLKREAISWHPPRAGEVALALRAAAINPSDFGVIGGTYGHLPPLPAVAGREGVAEVIAVGEGVDSLKPGDRVRMPAATGVWREAVTCPAEGLVALPTDLPVEQLATAFVNPPTVWRLLQDFESLKSGDWIIQNAANSALGRLVIRLARHRGLRTINLVRNPERDRDRLLADGADHVVADDDSAVKQIRHWVGGGALRLGLNSVGGESAVRLIKTLSHGGSLVTFGGMTGEKIRFPTRYLIFDDLRMRGFWLDRWLRENSADAVRSMMDAVFDLMRQGVWTTEVEAMYPLDNFMEALAHARRAGRTGKILLKSEWTV